MVKVEPAGAGPEAESPGLPPVRGTPPAYTGESSTEPDEELEMMNMQGRRVEHEDNRVKDWDEKRARKNWRLASNTAVAAGRLKEGQRKRKNAFLVLDANMKAMPQTEELPGSRVAWACALCVAIAVLILVTIASIHYMSERPYKVGQGQIADHNPVTRYTYPSLPLMGVQCCTSDREWTAKTGRDQCDAGGYINVNFVQRTINRTLDPILDATEYMKLWNQPLEYEYCDFHPHPSLRADPKDYKRLLCPKDNDFILQGVRVRDEIFHMLEIDFHRCSNDSAKMSFHQTCRPDAEIDSFFYDDEFRCFLYEYNYQIDLTKYFDEDRKYYAHPKRIDKAPVIRTRRFNHMRDMLQKYDLFHTRTQAQLASALIESPSLEAEDVDINWEVERTQSSVGDRTRSPTNFLRLYLRTMPDMKVIRIEPEQNASNLLEGIGGMAEYLMIILYFVPLSCVWCYVMYSEHRHKKETEILNANIRAQRAVHVP